MACAALLARRGESVSLLERGPRLGRKLSATGNGQGNVTNVHMGPSHYRSDDPQKVARILERYPSGAIVSFLESMGGAFLPDSRGRVYPAGRQASAVTDLFRRELARSGVQIFTGAHVTQLAYDGSFRLTWEGGQMCADAVVLAAGGKAARHFGTDGTAYSLAQSFGHTVTELSPVLVRLRSEPAAVRGLKGIRVDAAVRLMRGENAVFSCRGDVLFTENGVSGDAVFRTSSYAEKGDVLLLDLVPELSHERILASLSKGEGEDGLLCLVNNMVGRTVFRMAGGRAERAAALLKAFPVPVTGTLGFDYAQATRGGIPLAETDECLMSTLREGLYFAGEILNVDGECGGYNLHWAFASAHVVAEGMK